jgi:hypothetical protein
MHGKIKIMKNLLTSDLELEVRRRDKAEVIRNAYTIKCPDISLV